MATGRRAWCASWRVDSNSTLSWDSSFPPRQLRWPDNVRDKFLQIHGKPGLRDVLNQLAQYGAGQQMSYQTGRDLFTFTVTAENSLEAVDDWFDSD
ncbi:hypothetical protein FOVG_18169 [Fusarium oxysporum f. sp. pisi HDV247]|uniref:Uncharacterized protein n=1 Tax=Fusarium oxysporum f. sp. pisi HDV247 TaxID=1080344 RepID=W9NIB5_FUSOX|nr:hypothetical protein FOVG_18169 [Fusarium oxysporum f. sp. pisi HDV247]